MIWFELTEWLWLVGRLRVQWLELVTDFPQLIEVRAGKECRRELMYHIVFRIPYGDTIVAERFWLRAVLTRQELETVARHKLESWTWTLASVG